MHFCFSHKQTVRGGLRPQCNAAPFRRGQMLFSAWLRAGWDLVVPRGGIELSYILLNWRHFLNSGSPVYPSMYPAFNSHAARAGYGARLTTFILRWSHHFIGQPLAHPSSTTLMRIRHASDASSFRTSLQCAASPASTGLVLKPSNAPRCSSPA